MRLCRGKSRRVGAQIPEAWWLSLVERSPREVPGRRGTVQLATAQPLQLERPAAAHRFHKAWSRGGDSQRASQSPAGAQQRQPLMCKTNVDAPATAAHHRKGRAADDDRSAQPLRDAPPAAFARAAVSTAFVWQRESVAGQCSFQPLTEPETGSSSSGGVSSSPPVPRLVPVPGE